MVRAGGTLKHPASGTRVTDVTIEHALDSGRGHAMLDVPGHHLRRRRCSRKNSRRLTEGVIALVVGTISGQGRIDWVGDKVSSTGDFSTDGMDLAAPFGPVDGHARDDPLHRSARPRDRARPADDASPRSTPASSSRTGRSATSCCPTSWCKIERGEWPFMGGRLILRETILNFARPTAKRLTFEVVGLDAKTFVILDGLQGARRDRHVRRRPADDLRRRGRADRRRPARFAARRRDACLQWRRQQARTSA